MADFFSMSSPRHKPLLIWLSAIALLVQLLLPSAHAQYWARQNHDPLLFALCGQFPPSILAQLRKTIPPEVLAALETAGQDAGTLSCPLCKAMHAGHLAGNSLFVALLAVSLTRTPTLTSEPRAQHAGFLIHPRPRGPPAWA